MLSIQKGNPFYNSIVWLDNRTSELVDIILDHIPGRDLNFFKQKTGLPISTYFSALKLKWLMNEIPGIRAAIAEDRLLFGTIDTWLIWKLTGQHMTDVSNASRTLLMDIETLDWDPYLLDFFKIKKNILPQIKASSDYYGEITSGPLIGLPITGKYSQMKKHFKQKTFCLVIFTLSFLRKNKFKLSQGLVEVF